ncbi:MAG TPA: hypothetical protein VK059_05185 [Nocardioidaceae bacterium]|nr:hypothetical protein [Nocardioidaceae bacterium]
MTATSSKSANVRAIGRLIQASVQAVGGRVSLIPWVFAAFTGKRKANWSGD